jgi:replication factor A2
MHTVGFQQFGDSAASGDGDGRAKRKAYDEQTLIPVTIAMLKQTDSTANQTGAGAEALRDGRELHRVKLVGAIRSYEVHSTHIVYSIEDSTGLIEVKDWLNQDDNPASAQLRQEACQDHIYVRIIGQLKDYDGSRHIVADSDSIRKVQTGNEYTHHLLEVAHSAQRHQKTFGASPFQPSYNDTSSGVGFGGGGGGGGGMASVGQPMHATGQFQSDSKNPVNVSVRAYIVAEGESSDAGVDIHDCIQYLSNRHGEAEVRRAIEELTEEGHVYSTIDERHFKAA